MHKIFASLVMWLVQWHENNHVQSPAWYLEHHEDEWYYQYKFLPDMFLYQMA